MSDPDPLQELLAGHHRGVLATLRRNGRPQLSNIMYGYDRRQCVRLHVEHLYGQP